MWPREAVDDISHKGIEIYIRRAWRGERGRRETVNICLYDGYREVVERCQVKLRQLYCLAAMLRPGNADNNW